MVKIFLLLSLVYPSNPKVFNIELLNERGYSWKNTQDEYWVDISNDYQSIFKVKGVTHNPRVQKISWKTKNKYYWGNGIIIDEYWVVNPSSYTKNGIGYSMVGFLPEMKGKSVVIYGHYNGMVDSIMVNLK